MWSFQIFLKCTTPPPSLSLQRDIKGMYVEQAQEMTDIDIRTDSDINGTFTRDNVETFSYPPPPTPPPIIVIAIE